MKVVGLEINNEEANNLCVAREHNAAKYYNVKMVTNTSKFCEDFRQLEQP